MNAISSAFSSAATTPIPTLHGIGVRLAEIDRLVSRLQSLPRPRSHASLREETNIDAERDALHELVLTMTPHTLIDAAVILMVAPSEIECAVATAGPRRRWRYSKDDRAEMVADAVRRALLIVCHQAALAPEAIGGSYYLSHFLIDGDDA